MSTPEIRLTLENVFGTIGTILWCIQLLPQIYMNYKRKTTFGLTPYLYIGWILSGLLLGIYTVVQNSRFDPPTCVILERTKTNSLFMTYPCPSTLSQARPA
jgi:uncharacterized protein with PQ loop repeat